MMVAALAKTVKLLLCLPATVIKSATSMVTVVRT